MFWQLVEQTQLQFLVSEDPQALRNDANASVTSIPRAIVVF